MNGSPLKARDIEALTFVYPASPPATRPERNRWFRFLNGAWVKVRKRTQHPSQSVNQGV